MKIAALTIAVSIVAFSLFLSPARAQSKEDDGGKHDAAKPEGLKPEQQASKGSVTIAGKAIPYDAFAGTIVVHPKGWDDVPENRDKDDKSLPAEASMFYVAYFKSGELERRASGDVPSITVGRVRRACGCTWERLGRSAW